MKPFNTPGNRIPTRLTVRTKTHKPAGRVEHRNIHAGCKNAFVGLSSWIANKLESILASASSHLLRDNDDLVIRLRSLKATPNTVMFRLDVKHFFMSGATTELADAASLPVTFSGDVVKRKLLRDCIDFHPI